jgi:hypothetical protein
MDEAREAMLAVLDRHTLADILASRHAALRRRLGLPASANADREADREIDETGARP